MDEVAQVEMVAAHIRRKRWEAELFSGQLLMMLAESMGSGGKKKQMGLGALSALGFRIEG